MVTASYNGDPIPSMLVRLLLRDKTSEMQLAAAKCLAYLYRGGALDSEDPRIVNKVKLKVFLSSSSSSSDFLLACRYRDNIHISGPLPGNWLAARMADCTPDLQVSLS